jgi:hypothetical protein
MSLTRSLITQQHRPILDQLPVRLGLRQGQGVACGIAGPPMLLVMFGDNVREWTRIRSRLTGYFFIVYLGLLFIENQLIRDTVTNSESPIVALVVGAIFGIVISHKIELSMNADVWSRVGGYIVLAACIASITSKL